MNETPSSPIWCRIAARSVIAMGRSWPIVRGKNRFFSTLVLNRPWQPAFAAVMPVMRTKAGFRLHGSAVDYTCDWIRVFGNHEISTERFIDAHARRGSRMLDIGSNVGYFAFYSALVAGTESIAFEPNPAVTQSLRKTIATNNCADRVRVMQTALGAEDQSGRLVPDATKADLGGSRIEQDDQGGISVQRLDSVEKREGRFDNVSVVKIDVEGWELSVLRGMPEFLARERPALAVEDLHENYSIEGRRGGELEAILTNLGYREDTSFLKFDQYPSNRFFVPGGTVSA